MHVYFQRFSVDLDRFIADIEKNLEDIEISQKKTKEYNGNVSHNVQRILGRCDKYAK